MRALFRSTISLILIVTLVHLQVTPAYAEADVVVGNDGSVSITTNSTETAKDAVDSELTANGFTTLFLFMIGFLAPTFGLVCWNRVSAWIMIAASVTLMIREGIRWSEYQDYSESLLRQYEDADKNIKVEDALDAANDDTQLQTFKDLADMFENLATVTRDRANWFLGISIAYTLAAIMGMLEAVSDTIGSWGFGTAVAGACAGIGYHSPELQKNPLAPGQDQYFEQNFNTDPDLFVANIEASKSENDSYFLFNEWKDFKTGRRSSVTLSEYQRLSFFMNSPAQVDDSSWKDIFISTIKQASNIIVPPVLAERPEGAEEEEETETASEEPTTTEDHSGGQMVATFVGLGMGIVVPLLAATEISVSATFFSAQTSGWVRFGVFLVFAALGFTAMGFTYDAANKLDERAAEYDAIVTALEKLKDAQDTTLAPGSSEQAASTVVNLNAPTTVVKTPEKACSKNNQLVNCDTCLPSKSCDKVDFSKQLASFTNLPSTLSSLATDVSNMHNYTATGETAKADAVAASLGSKGAALKKYREKLQKEVNKKLIENKKQPIDFDKLESDAKAKFAQLRAKTLKSMTPGQLAALRNISGGVGNNVEGLAKKKEENKQVKELLAAVKPTIEKKTDTGPNFNFDFGLDDEAKPETAETSVAKAMKEDYEYNDGDDISKKSSVSIFKIITNRYSKSAFPVFFEEMK